MKIAPPPSLRIARETLLADVRDRLEQRLPAWAAEGLGDPTDPGWMLLEEAAWMVEALSEQLDQYPYAVLRQLVHLTGGERHPALPAVGAVSLAPAAPGVLREPADSPGALLLSTAQTETRDAISFALAEPAVPVRPGVLVSMVELHDGRIQVLGQPWREGVEGEGVMVAGPPRPSTALEHERLIWRLVTATPERTLATLSAAVERLAAEGPSWLQLSAAAAGEGAVEVVARVSVAGALRAAATVSPGGDLELRWGSLDESRWSPSVRLADDPRLPLAQRGQAPQPGLSPDSLLLPDLPPSLPVTELLVREPSPWPPSARDALWRAIVSQNLDLGALRPTLRHAVEPPEVPLEPRWLEAALASDHWASLARGRRHVLELRLPERARGAGRLRFALQRPASRAPIGARALALDGATLAELPLSLLWRLPVPSRDQRLDELVAFEVELGASHEGLLVVHEGPVKLAMLNPALVVNAPTVRDGRVVPIERSVPEAVSLRAEDVVGPDVRDRLLEQALPPEARAVLANLPLGVLTVSDHSQILDFEGVGLDASQGLLTLNAPDSRGELRPLRRGHRVSVDWYRRTDGAAGNVEAGEISFVDQRPGQSPRLLGVCNPTPTALGADRERDEDAIERLFGAPADAPVLAGDWERLLRSALGGRARGWILRCWTYAERTLVSHHLWPLEAPDAEALNLERALRRAGPDTLLVTLGPPDQMLTEQDFASCVSAIEAVVRRVRERNPAVRSALVTRLWPLTLERPETDEALRLPRWDAGGLEGELVDSRGRRAPSPAQGLLLNAAVVRHATPRGWSP